MANTVFCPGQVLTTDDLCIFTSDCDGLRTDVYEISYAIFDNTTGTELLIGSPTRTPEHPEVGQYCAVFRIPDFAPYGDYIIRWTFKQVAGGADHQVTQEFGVLPAGTTFTDAQLYTTKQLQFIYSLRIMLRDNCVGAEEIVLLDVDGELMKVRMDDLWEALLNQTVTSSTSGLNGMY